MSPNSQNDPEFNDVPPKPRSGRGFTLGEFFLVVAIIAVLIALLLPASRSARSPARRAQCTNNLKQIAMALRNYEEVHKALPPAYTVDASGRPLHSWRTLILPYLEQDALYRTIDLSKPWNDPVNAKALATPIGEFHCPASDRPENTTTYLAIVATNGCLIPKEARRLAEITDAHAKTLMMIEAGDENAVPWMAPVDADAPLVLGLGANTRLHHSGGMNACFVDGRVSFLKVSLPARGRRALMSISGDDEVSDEW
jgi:prepilin-type processing-associated H-X9-DG protein